MFCLACRSGSIAIYGTLAVIEVRLMIASIRKGPFEHAEDPQPAPDAIPAAPITA